MRKGPVPTEKAQVQVESAQPPVRVEVYLRSLLGSYRYAYLDHLENRRGSPDEKK